MQTKTYQEWIDEFNSSDYDLECDYFNFGNLDGAKSTKEWQKIMGKKRVLSDFGDQNVAWTLKGSNIRWVAQSQPGTNAKLYFLAARDMGTKISDSKLRPSKSKKDNKKTGRTWNYSVEATEIF